MEPERVVVLGIAKEVAIEGLRLVSQATYIKGGKRCENAHARED